MTRTTSEQTRQWQGPAILSLGLRPFFLLAALWAAVAMMAWVAMLSGGLNLPTRFDPVAWHAHEFLFGYVGAVVAGFLLTAVPNWTGRLPVVGWRLAGLVLIWGLGRGAVAVSEFLPAGAVIAADVLFLVVLWLVVLREILAGRSWSNLPVLALVGVLIFANLVFHLEAANGDNAAQGYGFRLGLSVILVLITLIGGKIIPSFTRNWLVKQNQADLPVPPMQRFDKITIVATVATLLIWSVVPDLAVTGVALVAVAGLHTKRLLRWKGGLVKAEPLLWVLHLAYAFLPLGAVLNGVAILAPDVMPQTTALHVWTAGAIGLMTVGVMTRAALGHSGRPLHAGPATVLIYLMLAGSVITRVVVDLLPEFSMALLQVSALLWVGSFVGFALVYGALLIRPKVENGT